MLEEEMPAGASNPREKVKGELLATFAVLRSTFELEGLELPWLVMMSLEQHIRQQDGGLEQWVDFTARLAKMSEETIAEIDHILHEDAKTCERFH